jgi:ribosomal protein L11 methyltransferase
LVIANILAGRLVEMAADLVAVMDDNGYAVLSGILNEQVDWVVQAYEAQGLTLKKTLEIGEWTTLVMKAP